MSDSLVDDFARALVEPLDTQAWEEWEREHGSGGGVLFEGGFRIPPMLDSVRYGIYRREGLAAMRDFDVSLAAR